MEKLFDSELKVMEILWREGAVSAGKVAAILKEEIGWNRNTTYTVIKKCIEKGVVERTDPKFICRALITRKDVQEQEMDCLINKMFHGSRQQFFAAFLSDQRLSKEELQKLRDMVHEME